MTNPQARLSPEVMQELVALAGLQATPAQLELLAKLYQHFLEATERLKDLEALDAEPAITFRPAEG